MNKKLNAIADALPGGKWCVTVTDVETDEITDFIIEALTDGGVSCGLPSILARRLAIQTVLGAAELAKETGEHPAILREMVTSPGGTTAAALGELEQHGVRAAFIQAVQAANRRSKELSGE